jgi:putative aminopeptidase FrvX
MLKKLVPAFMICAVAFAHSAGAELAAVGLRDLNYLTTLVETPAVCGYETEESAQIAGSLKKFHPVVDNLGDVIVTIGSGTPHRLIAAPIDEPGYIVGAITPDGYLRLRRLPLTLLPGAFNEMYAAQPVKIETTNNKSVNGVVAGLSIHLSPQRVAPPDPRDVDNMYVDVGASSAAEVRSAGIDVLSPVVINRKLETLNHTEVAGASVGDKFGAAALLSALEGVDSSKVSGTLTVAFVTQQWAGGRGLQRILATTPADELLYIGRMLPSAYVSADIRPPQTPKETPGSGVLLAEENAGAAPTALGANLQKLARANHLAIHADYSGAPAVPFDPTSDPPIEFPANWAHVGIATAWPDTPIEMVSISDFHALVDLLSADLGIAAQSKERSQLMFSGLTAADDNPPSTNQMLKHLVVTYGASKHEGPVRNEVKSLLPAWAKPETDDAGNLILQVGTAPASRKAPKILVIAHTDEIGFEIKSIDPDGLLEVTAIGGMYLDFFGAHPALVHKADGNVAALVLPPDGWDQPNFKWPTSANSTLKVDVGAHTAADVGALGIKVGDSLTIEKEYRPLFGTRANGRSFDDRVGDTALLAAVRALGGPLKDRNVTFVWSTGEELGLVGAGALARRLAKEGRGPDDVFAVDTFVSSDSPLESRRFADAVLGKGFVIRAVDSSNITPRKSVDRLISLARANQIPVQYGVTGGGNDGNEYIALGAVDVAIAWPLRYAHSPGEVIDTRDVDALARIVAVIAKSW